ncbi:MAG: hypothetical protein K2M06_02090 [Muribaculaceae bacterium]|nr:hypothetical protein [Muribaculaceae bacterium]
MNKRSNPILPDSLSSSDILRMLWANWGFGFGSIALLLLLSILIPALWLPFIAVIAAIYLKWQRLPACCATDDGAATSGILTICIRALWMSAATMFAIITLCTPFLIGRVILIPMYNDEIPFVACLVLFPCLALSAAWWLIVDRTRRSDSDGTISPTGALRAMLPREVAYQARILLLLSLLLSTVEAWYYLTHYINSNLNAPDRFFFVLMPIGFYLLSLFFMGGRYTSLSALVDAVDNIPTPSLSTLVRYLIFSDNEILVRPNSFGLYDSPAEIIRQDTEPLDEKIITDEFRSLVRTNAFRLRYLYRSESFSTNLNILHYAAILDEDLDRNAIASEDGDGAGDRWVGLYEIQRLAAEGKLSPVLASELVRIYAVTMAWKTYDRQGRRQYPIRNYRPTFRFRDLGKWDVDYDDTSWLDIADLNEDKPFFRIRRFFRRKKARARGC